MTDPQRAPCHNMIDFCWAYEKDCLKGKIKKVKTRVVNARIIDDFNRGVIKHRCIAMH